MNDFDFDWGISLRWLAEAENPNPGGWDGDDLFEMPLPEGFPEPQGEWSFSPWHGEQGELPGAQWYIGDTGYAVVIPGRGEPFILDPEGFIIG